MLFCLALIHRSASQSFTFEGDSSKIYLSQNDVSYTIYNEDSFNIADSSDTPAISLVDSTNCSAQFDRRLLIHGSLLASTEQPFQVYDTEQWKLVIVEDFQSQISGWSEDDISNCNSSPDLFLGGNCKFSNQIVSKTFSLPKHQSVRISGSFHFIDKWEGESAYLGIDDKFVWSESYVTCSNIRASICQSEGINVCGNDYPDRMGFRFSYTGPHSNSTLKATFGTTLKRDACEVSWGIDDIEIYII